MKFDTQDCTVRFLDKFDDVFYYKNSQAIDEDEVIPVVNCNQKYHVNVLELDVKQHKYKNWMKGRAYHARIQKKWNKIATKNNSYKQEVKVMSICGGLMNLLTKISNSV